MTLKLGNSLLKIKYFKMYVDCSSNVNRGSQLIERHAFEADRLGAKKSPYYIGYFSNTLLKTTGPVHTVRFVDKSLVFQMNCKKPI